MRGNSRYYKKILLILALLPVVVYPFALPVYAQTSNGTGEGASLSISPAVKNVEVGDTLEVSIYLDTGGENINTVDIHLRFSQDKLQVVSPSIGKSIIGIWTAPPSFNNLTGELHFQGGIPSPGITTSKGLISTITFRAKSVGTASVNFSGDSQILLNDGQGTNVLSSTHGGTYYLGLPAPAGPIVTSETHPNQDEWYKARTAILSWTNDYPVTGYSYVLNKEPVDIPDNISDGINTEVSYKNLADGIYYFHIKALRNGEWGGTTHFGLKIDSSPPADFKINVLPSARTTSRFPVIDFTTTDALSGISHYELRIVSLSTKDVKDAEGMSTDGFFIEVQSRYIPDTELELGDYDVIVRAYDNAGNDREVTKRVNIVSPILTSSRQGVNVMNIFVVPWLVLIIVGLLLLALMIYLSILAARAHRDVSSRRMEGALQDPVIKKRLEELQKRKQKFRELSHKVAAFVLVASALMLGVSHGTAKAQEVVALPPPIITTISKDISNDQLFYVGGQTDIADAEVTIFLQNLQDGQVVSNTIKTDHKGDWFYANPEPLLKGRYLLWAQTSIGSQSSPPSPQKDINVTQTALQLGSSRLSYETMYLLFAIILFIALLALGSYTAYHLFHGRRKRKELMHEVEEADAVIKEGFVTLHEDLAAELDVIHRARLNKTLTIQEKEREKHLLDDLEEVEKFIKKEFHDVELKSRTV